MSENLPATSSGNFDLEFLMAMLAVFILMFVFFYLGVPFMAKAFS